MSNYSEETRESHKSIVKRLIALQPTLTMKQVQKTLQEKESTELSLPYVSDIVKAVRTDWVEQYDYDTKALTAARFDELGSFLIGQLSNILKEEKIIYKKTSSIDQAIVSQANRIKAVKEIRETAKAMINMKMDLGILERHLGTIETDVDIIKARNIVADLMEYRKNHGNTIKIDAKTTS